MIQMIDFVTTLSDVSEIHLLPYHSLGVGKYRMLGMDYIFGHKEQVPARELEPYILYARSKRLEIKIGG